MKLKNKKTGETIEINRLRTYRMVNGAPEMFEYNSLAELNEEWEDYEEPKEYWYLCSTRNYAVTRVVIDNGTDFDRVQKDKEIGNYFETPEEAEKAVEKLKAWKRLMDKGFKITNWEFRDILDGDLGIEAKLNFDNTSSILRDLEVCFGGEK